MNQREATVNTILAVLQDKGLDYELSGPTPVSQVLTAEDKAKVRETLFAMFRFNQIDFKDKAKLADDKYLKDYVSGLTNNWIRKAPEFNCGIDYQAKNPGSRQGSSDEAIKEMRKLLSVTTDAQAKQVIQQAISDRQAELKPKATVNLDAIPAHLRAKLGL